MEYFNGNINRYCTDGLGKSLGLKICFNYPSKWSINEGNRPHVVKKFVCVETSEVVLFMINQLDHIYTQSEIQRELSENSLRLVGNDLGTYISHDNNLRIDGLKAASVTYKTYETRGSIKLMLYNVTYIFFYKDKYVTFMFGNSSSNSETELKRNFEKNKILYQLIINSIVVNNQWDN